MKRIAVICLLALGLFLSSSPSFAFYREAMKGQTAAEREIRWLWKYVYEFALSCSQSTTDCQDAEIRKIARDLATYAPPFDTAAAGSWAELLQFVSERQNPDFFKSAIGEAHRLMLTKTAKNSTVYINSDRMAIGLQDLLGLLVHEAVHHLGYLDDSKRLPDRVGAEVAKHFQQQLQRSSLEQFNLPQAQLLTFNSEAPDRASVGFWSWGAGLSDLGWEPAPLQPVCDPENEKLRREFVSAATWRVNHFKPKRAVVNIRGGGYVRTICENRSTGALRTNTMPLGASVFLQYPSPFDQDRWQEQTPSVIEGDGAMGPSINPMDHLWGLAQTFAVLSVKHEIPKLTAGSKWRTSIKLKSLDGWTPNACKLYLAGAQYAVITQDTLPGIQPFAVCKLTALSNQEWLVEGEVDFPRDTRPDRYYVPVVILASPETQRTAVPTIPTFVQVENPGAPPPPVVRELRIRGLNATRSIGTHSDLTNSYLAEAGREFTVEFDVEGLQAATDQLWFDVTFWYQGAREFLVMEGTGSAISLPQYLIRTEVTPISGGTRIRMFWKMPEMLGGQSIAAVKFKRIYTRTSDFSWAEIETPGIHEAMVVNPRYSR